MAGFLNSSSCGFAKIAMQLCKVNKPFFTDNANTDENFDQNMTTGREVCSLFIIL